MRDFFADELKRIKQRRAGNDRGAVLIVMEDRDLHGLLQPFFDMETFGRLDIFEVDPAKAGFQELHALDEELRVLGLEFQVDRVDVGEALEQESLSLHHGFARQGPDIAQAQDGRPVSDNSHKVPFTGILEGGVGVLGDLQARLGHTRGVRQREIVLSQTRLGRSDLQFSRRFFAMVL